MITLGIYIYVPNRLKASRHARSHKQSNQARHFYRSLFYTIMTRHIYKIIYYPRPA